MTAPVPVYPNSTIAGGRKTEHGVFYLIPTEEVRNIIVYLFLYYAEKYNIRLLVLCILSNHVHWVADDPDGNYPAFHCIVYSKITEVLNDYYGRTGPLWANCKPQRTRLLDSACIEDKMLYAATNGTWHGIEPRSRDWAGFVFSPEDIGKTIAATCPEYLADNYTSYPDRVTYTVPKPACYCYLTAEGARSHFAKKRAKRDARIAAERGDDFIGNEVALAENPMSVPDPRDDPRDLRNKLFDASRADVYKAAWDDLDSFRREYGGKRREFNDGDRDVEWPHGTYAMRVWHGCPACRH